MGDRESVVEGRWVDVGGHRILKMQTRTRYVPETGAEMPSIAAAARPDWLASTAPLGAHSRIQGRKSLLSVISPMFTAIRSPALAVKVHTSTSPWTISPVCVAPLVRGPP